MTQPEFIDFCIACGCDYNQNIPKVGPVKVHELIRDHRSIDRFPGFYKKLPLDTSILKHERCRELFAPCPSAEIIDHEKSSASLTLDAEKFLGQRDWCMDYFGKYTGAHLDNDLNRVHAEWIEK